ncbi:glycosyltransferase family 39 protein [Frankia sp. Cas4]|uniref:glycosyltransferase family 39 protein n=1 Tax=Frankia sp. Cas4 TaxID=3073927 RepID=UPI002AD33EB1|nr:glycosyltransferase family 39 protein [Frankia sp. Cas4]
MRQVSTDTVLAERGDQQRLDYQELPGAVSGTPGPASSSRGRASRLAVSVSGPRLAVFALGTLSFTASVVLQETLFRHGSGDADEAAYVLQARMLLHGRLTLDQNLVDPFFRPWLTGVHNGRVFTKYLPGWPAMLAVSQLLFGTMVLAPALVAAAWVVATYRLARELFDDVATALTSAAFLALSPLVLLHTALPMAYAFTAAALTAAMAALLRGTRIGARRSLVAAGAAFGLAAMARPFDAVLVAVVGVLFVTARFVRARFATARFATAGQRPRPVAAMLRDLGWVGLGGLPFVVAVAAFCRHVTGSMRTLPLAASDPLDRFGFGERRMLPSEPTFAFTGHVALDALRETLAAAPGWLFGGTALVVLAGVGLLAGLAAGGRRAGHLLLAITALGVFAAYFFWWGSAMAVPSLRNGLGPHYHMVALSPVVILAGSGACLLWRAVPGRLPRPVAIPVAGVCGLALVAVTAVGVPAKVNVQRYVNAVDGYVLDLIPDNFDGPAVVIVTPPTPSRYTQVPYQFLRNSPDLSDQVLYAADLGAADGQLAERMPGRRLYQLRPDEVIEAEKPWSFRGSFVELRPVEGKKIEVRASASVPANMRYASFYLRIGEQTVTSPLPVTGAAGTAASVVATVDGARALVTVASPVGGSAMQASVPPTSVQEFSFAGAVLPAQLTVGLAAGTTPDLTGAWRWEERIPLERRADGVLVALGPGPGWRLVPGRYDNAWVPATVTGTLGVTLAPRR